MPTNKYAEGYPGRRYYGGCEVVDQIEQLAIDRAKALFGAEHANVQPHAGAQTNMAVYSAVMDPGDTMLALRLDHGGHLTHGLKVNFSGRLYNVVHYGVSRETMTVDYDEVLALAKEARPKLIVCGGSAYPRTVEADRFRADRRRGRRAPALRHGPLRRARGRRAAPRTRCRTATSSPRPRTRHSRARARVSSSAERSTRSQSTARSSRGCRAVRSCTPSPQRRPASRSLRASPSASTRRRSARTPTRLAAALTDGGLDILTGGTDTHLMQIDLRASEWTGKDAQERLEEVGITTNRNTVPFDERPPMIASGVRVGTPAVTMRGFDETDVREVARMMVDALSEQPDLDDVRSRVRALCERRPLYPGFRGWPAYTA